MPLRKSNRRIPALLFSFVLACARVGAASDELPRIEAIFPQFEPILKDALDQSPRMIARNLEYLQSEAMTGYYSSRLYPSVSASLQFNVQRDERGNVAGSVNSEKLYYSFGITQPLYHWGALRASARTGRILEEISANNVAEAYRLLALEIRAAYLQLIITKAAASNARYEAGLAQKRLEAVEARVRGGGESAGATAPAKLAISEATLAVDRAEYALEVGIRDFRRLTGAVAFDVSMIPGEIPPVSAAAPAATHPFRINYVEKEGFLDTSRRANAKLEIARERLVEHGERVRLRPTVDLVAGMYQDELSYTLDVSRRDRLESLYLGFRFSWNIFDGFASRAQLRATRARLRWQEHRLVELEADLVAEAEQAEKDLGFHTRALGHAEERFFGSQAGIAYAKSNLASGRGSELDVEIAQSGANAGLVTVFHARAAYLNTLARFLSIVNEDAIAGAARREILNR